VIGILGPVVVRSNEPAPAASRPVPARLDRAVLVHLVLAEGRALSVDLLTDAVWGQHPPRNSRNALQVKISRLRALLGPHGPALVHSQGSYRIAVDDHEVDARRFARLLQDATRHHEEGSPEAARTLVEEALGLWRGEPLSDLDDHPRLVAARLRLHDERAAAHELRAVVALEMGEPLTNVIARLRRVLDHDPLRPRARLLLMQALERSGRRAEALAVYDAGRRVLAEETGLAPAVELQDAFRDLMAEEKRAARREAGAATVRSVPSGAMETARWLAAEGERAAAVSLALRGSWWWWFGGNRTAGRDLLEALLDVEASTASDSLSVLRLSAWHAVFQAVEADARTAIHQGTEALEAVKKNGWTRHEALAAALLSERMYERGSHASAHSMLAFARETFVSEDDEWGVALADLVDAKATLLGGDVVTAGRRANLSLRAFDELGDPAGQIMALDLAGYCAEVRGDLSASVRIHRRALDLARRSRAPEWEASQLIRLGSVLALGGIEEGPSLLQEAVDLASGVNSRSSLAFAENGLGLAASMAGDEARAAVTHRRALGWYEKQESPAGISYSAGRLAQSLAAADVGEADRLARRATDLALQTGDPRAIAHAFEAVAHVVVDPRESARALGAARALRKATRAPLPSSLNAPLIATERLLHRRLGDQLVLELRRGARDTRRLLTTARTRPVR
jgi:DNA-binding SARP family transcriptional activator